MRHIPQLIKYNKDDDPKIYLMNKPWFEREVLRD